MTDSAPQASAHPYDALTPDLMLDAVESVGYVCDGGFLALNSYENRVYQIGIEDGSPVVAKFYRPQRWTDAAIREEHAFALELVEHEIPVVAPLAGPAGDTLCTHADFRFAVYPRRGGRWPELDDPEVRSWIGRFLGRIHALGAERPFSERPVLDIESVGRDAFRFIVESDFLPPHIEESYRSAAELVLERISQRFDEAAGYRVIRLHGDCHPGNILWTQDGPHFVDLDDCRSGPAVQDLWMLLSGERAEQTIQIADIVEGYEMFCDFDSRQLVLVEALRGLRMIYYAGWLARRWKDPAFPANFPWFNTPRYWEEQVNVLLEQSAKLEEPPLFIG